MNKSIYHCDNTSKEDISKHIHDINTKKKDAVLEIISILSKNSFFEKEFETRLRQFAISPLIQIFLSKDDILQELQAIVGNFSHTLIDDSQQNLYPESIKELFDAVNRPLPDFFENDPEYSRNSAIQKNNQGETIPEIKKLDSQSVEKIERLIANGFLIRNGAYWIQATICLTQSLEGEYQKQKFTITAETLKTLLILISASEGLHQFSLKDPYEELAIMLYGEDKFHSDARHYRNSIKKRLQTIQKWQERTGITLVKIFDKKNFELPIINYLKDIIQNAVAGDRRKFRERIAKEAHEYAKTLNEVARLAIKIPPKISPISRFQHYIEKSQKRIENPSYSSQEIEKLIQHNGQDEKTIRNAIHRIQKRTELIRSKKPDYLPRDNATYYRNMGIGVTSLEHNKDTPPSPPISPEKCDSSVTLLNNQIIDSHTFTKIQNTTMSLPPIFFESAKAKLDWYKKVGVTHFDFEFYLFEDNGRKRQKTYLKNLTYQQALDSLPSVWERIQQKENVNLTPKKLDGKNISWILELDDVTPKQLERIKHISAWIQRTSPDNYQVSLLLDDPNISQENADFILKRLKTSLNCQGSKRSRLTGATNWKPKYAPNFPLVEVIENRENQTRTINEAELIEEKLIEEKPAQKENKIGESPTPLVPNVFSKDLSLLSSNRKFPKYSDYLCGDRSDACFMFARVSMGRGFTVGETIRELQEVSEKARERGIKYVELTVKKALESLRRDGYYHFKLWRNGEPFGINDYF